MKKTMKIIMSGLLTITLLAGMTACGGNGQQKKETDSVQKSNNTEVNVQGNTEPSDNTEMAKEIDFYSSILKEEGCLAIAKEFEEKTGIKVNVHSYDSADFVQAFMVAANGGSPIDVMLLNGQDVRYFMKNNLIQEMDGKPGESGGC